MKKKKKRRREAARTMGRGDSQGVFSKCCSSEQNIIGVPRKGIEYEQSGLPCRHTVLVTTVINIIQSFILRNLKERVFKPSKKSYFCASVGSASCAVLRILVNFRMRIVTWHADCCPKENY
jgi:hypothetical protein